MAIDTSECDFGMAKYKIGDTGYRRPRYCQIHTLEIQSQRVPKQMTEVPQQGFCEACSKGTLGALACLSARITKSLASVDPKAVPK